MVVVKITSMNKSNQRIMHNKVISSYLGEPMIKHGLIIKEYKTEFISIQVHHKAATKVSRNMKLS